MTTEKQLAFLAYAVRRAIAEYFPEDGALQLKPLILEGFRSAITDELLEILKMAVNDADTREKAVAILYFLHGTTGSWSLPGIRDPRPENAKSNDPITKAQLACLIELALSEKDVSNWENYLSLLRCMWPSHAFTDETVERLKRFIRLCREKGSPGAVERAKAFDIW